MSSPERNAEPSGERTDEAVFLLGFLPKPVIDVEDDEAFRGVFLLAAFRQEERERHRVGSAAHGKADAARGKDSIVYAHGSEK